MNTSTGSGTESAMLRKKVVVRIAIYCSPMLLYFCSHIVYIEGRYIHRNLLLCPCHNRHALR